MTATVSNAPMAMETKARPWWLVLLQGVFALLVGIALLWSPGNYTAAEVYRALVSLLGLYWLVSGIFDLVHMFVDHTGWGWKLFSGIIGIIAGSYILMYPIAAGIFLPEVFVLVMGIWGVMQGTVALILAFKGGGWGLGILGAVGIVFGLILMANYAAPGMGLTFIWVAAIWAVLGGIMMIVQAFRLRSA
jgi:uncharacterized membrane protein HdeD (DUF308 family)